MKTASVFVVVILTSAVGLWAGTAENRDSQGDDQTSTYQAVATDGNQRVWQRQTQENDADGKTVTRVHKYVELGTGLNFWNNGRWQESRDEILTQPDGTAAATNGPYQAFFPGDIYQGAIRVVTPDGKPVVSRPAGLYYFDGKQVVLFARVTNSLGQMIESNKVIYVNAFNGIKADIIFSYSRSGFEQDVLLRQAPPSPETFGMDSSNTRLQVFTEFFNQPDSAESNPLLQDADGTVDTAFRFGKMKMVPGRAFYTATTNQVSDVGVPVYKSWVQVLGRSFLVEDLLYDSIAPQLDQLQASVRHDDGKLMTARVEPGKVRPLPTAHPVSESAGSVQLATTKLSKENAVVLDYMLVSGTITNFTFQGDTTYLMTPTFSIWFEGTTTVEGGAVIKFPTNSANNINFNNSGHVVFNTTPYNPAIFTALDDNTVGETIAGSTGNPIGYYGTGPMNIFDVNNYGVLIHDARFSYLQGVFNFNATSVELDNVQVINCSSPFILQWANLTVNNGLFYNIGGTCINTNGGTPVLTGSQVTAHHVKLFTTTSSSALTNCLLVNVTNILAVGTWATNKVVVLTNETGVFQTLGAGAHYLAASTYRDVGTTNISTTALSMITGKTTFAPTIYSNVTFSVSSNLINTVLRDTNTPDLGYHYAPIDYITDGLTITNSALTITNPGTAIACYNQPGILLHNGSTLLSSGLPQKPNWFTRYQLVQELSVNLHGTNLMNGQNVSAVATTTNRPNGTFQFSRFSAPPLGGWHLNDSGTAAFTNLVLQYCEFYGGTNNFSGATNTSVANIQNNLFFRSPIFASNAVTTTTLAISNNLIFGGALSLVKPATGAWYFFNNDVDSCAVAANCSITNGYNAFINSSNSMGGTGTYTSTNLIGYQAGALGNFYQPSSSPLFDAGSVTATAAGLYQFTTTTNQTKETNSQVDIGYHYVAVGSNGLPLDANANGTSDYLDQAPFITTQPISQTVLVGTNATFTVGAIGSSPLTYQWFFNATNKLAGATNTALTLANVQLTNVGSYLAVASNSFGMATSIVATLTVNAGGSAPSITSQPTNLTVIQSSNATFSVVATGTAPLAYQWYFNTTNKLTGAVTNFLTVTNVQATNAGNYTVVITNAYGNVTSSVAVLTVLFPVVITAQPTNLAVLQGGNATFNVTATGTALSYQWYFNATNLLAGATNASLLLSNVQPVNAGNYSVLVTNSISSVTSSNATLTVNTLPSITTQPTNLTVILSSNAVFNVVATGTAPLSYQWYFNVTNRLTGATANTLNITNTQATNAGNYIVIITNAFGSVTSSTAILSLIFPVAITAQPTNFTVLQGGNVAFAATVTGTAPAFQWYYNATNLLAGATNASLLLSNVQPANAGIYNVVVTNLISSVSSSNAILTVNSPPTIATQPTNTTVVQGSNAVFNVVATGTAPLSYQWYFNTTNKLAGATASSITLTNVQTTNAGSYSVIVTNNFGAATSLLASLTVTSGGSAPIIVSQPTNTTAVLGSNTMFTVAAAGLAPLSYWWYFNNTNLVASSNGNALILTNVQATNAGSYFAVVSNALGSITSSVATLTVWLPPSVAVTNPLSYQAIPAGTNITVGASATTANGTITKVEFFLGSNSIGTVSNAPYLLPETNVQPGTYVLSAMATDNLGIYGVSSNVTIYVSAGVPFNGLQYWWKAEDTAVDSVGNNHGTLQTGSSFSDGQVGQAFALDGTNGFVSTTLQLTNPQNFSLACWFETTTASGGALVGFDGSQSNTPTSYDRIIYLDNTGKLHFGIYDGSVETVDSSTTYNDGIWHQVVATISNSAGMRIYIDGALVSSNAGATTPENTTGWWRIGASRLANWPFEPNSYYLHGSVDEVMIYNRAISATEVSTIYSSGRYGTNPPTIITHPASTTAVQGTNVVFNVTAGGLLPLAYQWRFMGTAIPGGATNPSLTLTNISQANAGNYSVMVSNYFGTAISSDAVLTVASPIPPSITITNPANNSTFPSNSNIHLDATTVAGSGAITRVQFFQGTNSLGIISNAPYGMVWSNVASGNYVVTGIATDSYGLSTTSQVVNVTVTSLLSSNSLALWLKADAITGLTNNAGVATWFDQSGWSNNAAQNTSANQPAYVTNAVAGMPVVRFTGAHWLSIQSQLGSLMNTAGQGEALVVLKSSISPSNGCGLWALSYSSLDSAYPAADGSVHEGFGMNQTYNGAVSYSLGVPAQSLQQYHIYNVSAQTNDWTAWINGVGVFHSANNAYYFSLGQMTLGSGGQGNFVGDIAEMMFFNRVLTQSERSVLNAYLNIKYALVPAVPATPSNLLATAVSPTQVSLTWNESLSGGTTVVNIERASTSNGVYTVVGQRSLSSSYLDTNLTAGTTYYYRVRAINTIQWSDYSAIAQATTPASGSGIPLQSLALWLKADSGLVQNSTNMRVALWPDQSGNTNNAVQNGSASQQPVWVAQATGDRPVVRFSGSQLMSISSSLTTLMQATNQGEALVVLKSSISPGNSCGLWQLSGNGFDSAYPAGDGSIHEGFGTTSFAMNIGTPTQPLTDYHVYNISAAGTNWTAWINGVLIYQKSNNAYAFGFGNNPVTLASDSNGNFVGDIAEVMFFNRALTPGERTNVNLYLNSKYFSVPLAPTNVTALSLSQSQIRLNWASSYVFPGVFSIERSASSNGGFNVIAQVTNSQSFYDSGLSGGTTYFYRLRVINPQFSTTNSPYSVVVQATTSTNSMLPIAPRLWLRADAGVVTNSTGQVSQWSDQSGFNNDATQPFPTSYPQWLPSVTGTNPVIRFNGSNAYFNVAAFLNGSTSAEAFVVLKVATNQLNGQNPLWELGGDWWNSKSYPASAGTIRDDFGSQTVKQSSALNQPLDQFHIYEVSSQTNSWDMWINQMLQAHYASNSINFNPGFYGNYIGFGSYAVYYTMWTLQNGFFSGDIAEIMVYNQPLTSDARRAINNYLNDKYALVPAVPATPTNLTAVAFSPSQISLTWDEALNSGATQIAIERASASNGTYQAVATVNGANSFIDSGLSPAVTYYYRARAINTYQWSPYSSVVSATTLTIGTNIPLNSLALWLKADAGLLQAASNSPVSIWRDQSGQTNDAVGYGSPLCVQQALGGRPVVRFDGSNSWFSLPNFMSNATGAEAIVVLKVSTSPSIYPNSLWEFGGDAWGLKRYTPGEGSIQDDFGSSGGPAPEHSGVKTFYTYQPLDQFHLYDVSSQSNNWSAWINGILQWQSSDNIVSFRAGMTLGVSYYASYTFGWLLYPSFFHGDIAEVMVFNRGLTPLERQAATAYLNSKYSLVPAIPATPSNLVATAVSPTQVALTWNGLTNGASTRTSIERCNAGVWAYQPIGETTGTTLFLDTNAAAGTTYFYRVRTLNISQWSGYSGAASVTTPTIGTVLPFGSMALWLRADAGFIPRPTNTPVSFWADQSGNRNNAIQMNVAARPVRIDGTNGTFPTIWFNGTNCGFNMQSFLGGFAGAEAFVVLKVAATNEFHSLWSIGGVGYDLAQGYPNADGSVSDNFGSLSVRNIGVPPQALDQYHVYELSAQSDNWQAWINGQMLYQLSPTDFNTVSFAPSPTLGSANYYGNNGYGFYSGVSCFSGNMAEVIVFNRTLTQGERLAVNAYLKGKYSLAPAIAIISPVNNAVLNGVTNLTVTATNYSGIALSRMDFYQGTNWLGVATNAPYSLVWSNLTMGCYSLTAQATDMNGLVYTSAVVNVTVPGIAITAPTNNSVWPAATNLSISATVVDGAGIAQIQFLAGTNSIATLTNAPYGFIWSNIVSGTYGLTARATDNNGLILTSPVVNVVVDGVPSVTLTNPLNNARVAAGTNVLLQANATNFAGAISQVGFYQGTNLIGLVSSPPYNLTWSNVVSGNYALTARATSGGGLITTSAMVNLTVAGIVVTNPLNFATLTAPGSVAFASSVIDSMSVTQVQYFSGATSLGTASTAPYSLNWTNIAAGTYLVTATATDSGGLSFTSPAINVVVDATPSSTDRDGDGVSDLIESLQGRNPLVNGSVGDTNGVVNLQIFTPLQ